MRSIKSILGSDLMEETTELASGLQIRYCDVVIAYLRPIKQLAEKHWQCQSIEQSSDARYFSSMTTATRCEGTADFVQGGTCGLAYARGISIRTDCGCADYESRLRASDTVNAWCWWLTSAGGTSDFSVVRAERGGARPSRSARGHPGELRPALGGHRLRPGGKPHRRSCRCSG